MPEQNPIQPMPVERPELPFGGEFFVTVFPDRVREQCRAQPEHVPVVELHLTDGGVLDLCHIELMSPQWIGVMAYRDTATCAEMDLHFVPYASIRRVVVGAHAARSRPLGFDVDHAPRRMAGRPRTEDRNV